MKGKKSLSYVSLIVFFILFSMIWSSSAVLAAYNEITSSDSRILVDTSGGGYSFYSKTQGRIVPLLYPSRWDAISGTSKFTARIDGVDYILGPYGRSTDGYTVGSGFIEVYWYVGGVKITQRFSIPFSSVMEQRMIAESVDGGSHTVGFRVFWDTDVDGNDAARFNVFYGDRKEVVYYETIYTGSNMPDKWEVYTGNLTAYSYMKNFYVTTPDKLILGRWPTNISTTWDTGSPGASYSDSAAIMYWYPATLNPGQKLERNIWIGGNAPNNHPPVITGFSYSPQSNIVAGYTNMSFSVTAHDPDGDPITFLWQAKDSSGRTLNIGNSSSVSWTPPYSGTWTVNLLVSDDKGGMTNKSITFDVRDNKPPVIQNISYSPNPAVLGRDVNLNVFAVDPDGDPITYVWKLKKPNGQEITLSNNATPIFKPDMPGDWTVTVTVKDPYGGFVTKSMIINVADFNLIVSLEPSEVSRGQNIMIYASLSISDGDRIKADSISAIFSDGTPIQLRWDSFLNRYIGEYIISEGGSDGLYNIKVHATKYGITKEKTLNLVVHGNLKEKVYIRQIQY